MLASNASRIIPTPRLGLNPLRPASVLALLVIPLVLMLVFSALPQLDVQLPAPWFHFQVVSFTSIIALVAAILIGNLAGPRGDVRALFVTFGLIAIAAVFLVHGVATPGALFDTSVPVDHSAHAAILAQSPVDEYGSPAAYAPASSSSVPAAVLAVTWSAPISLFVGALLFGLAVLPWSSRRQQWIGANRRRLWWVAVVLYAAYVAIALVFPAPLAELSRLSPASLYALAALAMLSYAGAALYFWNLFRRRRQLAEGGMAVAAGLLAEAVVSMTLMPLWHLSWWLYHVLMAVAFICALGAVVIEYEHVRHFDLKHYFAAMSVVVVAVLALVTGELATWLFWPLVSPEHLNEVRWGVSGVFVGMAALMLLVLYQIVRRGDRLLTERTNALQKQQASLERARMAAALVPIGLAIGASLDLDRVLDTICEESGRLFAVDGAYLWLKEGDELVGRAGRGHKRAEFIGGRLSLKDSNQTSVRVVCEQQPLLFNDAQNGQTARDSIVERLDACALLGVPLVRDGDVLGALILTHVQATNQFEPADLKVATIFGQQAALALTHAHLYATIKRQLYELSTLLAISTTLRQATGQEKVVEGLLSQAVGTLSVAGGAVHLIDSERGEVEAVRALGVMASQQKQRLPLEGSLTAHVVEQRRPYFSNGHAEAEPGAEQPTATNGNGHGILTLPMQAGETAVGALSLAFPSAHEPSSDDLRLAQTIAEIGGIAIQRVALHEKTEQQAAALAGALSELRGSYQATLRALSVALDARDRETEGHSQRVTNYAMQLARVLNMANCETLEPLEWGALLHDVGKIGVPDAILLKPGALTEEEWQIMRRHPETGHAILRGIPFLHGALDVVLSHHEHWDGSGYPSGLRGDEIPLLARIFAVADALDAITTARPYRAGRSFGEARAEIVLNGGIHFDPTVVAAYQSIPDTEWQALAGRLSTD